MVFCCPRLEVQSVVAGAEEAGFLLSTGSDCHTSDLILSWDLDLRHLEQHVKSSS
jgi:cysteine sulfinate desulfinase/cysteine desulfurase-like protein